MVTIGDSFSIAAILVGIGLTVWALILGFALMFASRSSAARDKVSAGPWKAFVVGVLNVSTIGLFGLILAGLPNPVTKLFGMGIILFLLSLATTGAAGICMMLAERIRFLDPKMSVYGALSRSAAIVTVAGFTPVLGWFFLGPILLIVSLGAGTMALVGRAGVRVNEGS